MSGQEALIERAAQTMTWMLEDADRLDALLNELGIGAGLPPKPTPPEHEETTR